MPRLPRSERRTYTPRLDFDRPPVTNKPEDLLAGIPEHLWDVPTFDFYDGDTPRQAAKHAAENGCLECRRQLDQLKETL